jgi:hypothetical protein
MNYQQNLSKEEGEKQRDETDNLGLDQSLMQANKNQESGGCQG